MKKRLLTVLTIMLCIIGFGLNANADIINSDFESNNLSGWFSKGQTGVQSNIVYDGNYAAWIGTVDFNDNDYNDFTAEPGTEGYTNNYIAQIVDPSETSSLNLWYNYYTWDGGTYDNPGFEIQINGVSVLSIKADDVPYAVLPNGTIADYGATGWTLFTHDLTGYSGATLLAIYSGNTGDDVVQSWAYIDSPSATNGTAPVPEPATILLLGTGLLCLVGIGRKRFGKKD